MTHVLVRIPTPLRGYTRGADEVRVEGATVRDALASLGRKHAGILERVLDANGELRPFVNIFLGADDVRTLDGLATKPAEGAVLSIIPAVAGGILS
jgi:molybdopterin converting factor small subunit